VRALTVHDQKTVEVRDLSAQFYLTEEDVGQNRAEACKEKLQELNNAVDVSASSADLTPDYLEQFQVCGCGVVPPEDLVPLLSAQPQQQRTEQAALATHATMLF
jgi:ubiquitin-activating enzyme E1